MTIIYDVFLVIECSCVHDENDDPICKPSLTKFYNCPVEMKSLKKKLDTIEDGSYFFLIGLTHSQDGRSDYLELNPKDIFEDYKQKRSD